MTTRTMRLKIEKRFSKMISCTRFVRVAEVTLRKPLLMRSLTCSEVKPVTFKLIIPDHLRCEFVNHRTRARLGDGFPFGTGCFEPELLAYLNLGESFRRRASKG